MHQRTYASGASVYSIAFAVDGRTEREVVGEKLDAAIRQLAQRRRQVAEGTYRRGVEGATGEVSLATYAARALDVRADRGVRTIDRERQLFRDHIAPHLGAVRLTELTPQHVERWIDVLIRAGKLAPKSILNAHGVLSALLSRARFDGLVLTNPARELPRGTLPENRRRREVAAWTRAEVAVLISDERIPEDRRVAYAIAAHTGARLGEVAGLRWRDLDVEAPGLWRWALRTQYDGTQLKTERPRDVPIHRELARMLDAWRLDGWAKYVGRAPRPTDFVVPRIDGTVHSDASLGAKALHRHAKLAGIDSAHRDFHSFRRFMISAARAGGARELYLERVTHNAAGSMLDRYTYAEWPALCAAVACVRLTEETPPELHAKLHASSETGSFLAETDWRRRESNPRPRVLY